MNTKKELRQIKAAQTAFAAWVVQTPDLPVVCQTPPQENCQVCGSALDLIGAPHQVGLGYTSIEMACPNRQRSSFRSLSLAIKNMIMMITCGHPPAKIGYPAFTTPGGKQTAIVCSKCSYK